MSAPGTGSNGRRGRDGMVIEKDVPVPTRDGRVLRADVFRPLGAGPFPVLLVHGPYGKDIHFADFNAHAYGLLDEAGPYMTWETPNPEWWVPHGYAVVRVDSRGAARSPAGSLAGSLAGAPGDGDAVMSVTLPSGASRAAARRPGPRRAGRALRPSSAGRC